MSPRPHIVWIHCDQLRADALGFMGSTIARTPNLDRLAGMGVVFDNMFVQSPVCMPSRGAMITGRYPENIGMGAGSSLLGPGEITVPEVCQRAGWRTGMFGKLHLTPQQYTHETLKSDRPLNDPALFAAAAGLTAPWPDDPVKRRWGFQELVGYEDALPGEYYDWLATRDAELAAEFRTGGRGARWRQDYPGTALSDTGVRDVPAELHPSAFIADAATAFFHRRHREAPCYLHVSFVDPHHPWDPPAEIAAHYPAAAMPAPRHREPGNVVWPPGLRARTVDFSAVTDAMARHTVGLYQAMIETFDRAIGRLVAAIEDAGELDRTIFAFVADHGELLGDYGLWRKGSYHYDCMLRSPAFITAPGRLAGGRRVTGLTQTIDLAPTLLALAGLEIPPAMQGANLAPALRSGADIGRAFTYTQMYTAWWGPFVACRTVRTPTAKLSFYPDDGVGLLFDLAADPDELNNLWDDPAARGLRDDLTALLLRAIEEARDPRPRILSQY